MSSIVDLAAIVADSVRNDKIVDLQHHIVAAYLVKHLLCDIYRGSLILHDNARLECTVIHHCVAPAAHAVEL